MVRIERGKMTVRNRGRFADAIEGAKDGDYILTLERQHPRMSDAQRAYYFGVIVERIAAKWDKQVDATHELLKAQFLPIDMAMAGTNGTLVNGLVIGGSLTKLNKLQTCEYFDRIVDHSAEHWDCYIPPADPLWREHAEEEARKESAA